MCVNPINIKGQVCACGKCVECIKDKQNSYAIRSMEEARGAKNCYFVTLTFSENAVPFTEDGEFADEDTGEVLYGEKLRTLDNKLITNWKKRVRIAFQRKYRDRDSSFGYLICGEYGPKTNRPHYHCLFVNIDPELARMLENDWKSKFGYTLFKSIPYADVIKVSNYVSKYITKPAELEYEAAVKKFVQKPRIIVSQNYGLGNRKRFDAMRKHYLGELAQYDVNDFRNIATRPLSDFISVVRRLKYRPDGSKFAYKLPKFYKDRLFKIKENGTFKVTELSNKIKMASVKCAQYDFAKTMERMAARAVSRANSKEYVAFTKLANEYDKASRVHRANVILTNLTEFYRKSTF